MVYVRGGAEASQAVVASRRSCSSFPAALVRCGGAGFTGSAGGAGLAGETGGATGAVAGAAGAGAGTTVGAGSGGGEGVAAGTLTTPEES